MASTLIGTQAVVIGAGMGGLTAAGALADHFDQVLVLERDTLPSEPTHRAAGRRPSLVPLAFALASPALTRSRIMPRSNSAKTPHI